MAPPTLPPRHMGASCIRTHKHNIDNRLTHHPANCCTATIGVHSLAPHHNSRNGNAPLNPDNHLGYDFKFDVEPIDGETIVTKTVHSAFIEPELRDKLSELGTKTLILAGVKTNNSIEATVRHGHNLGFNIHLLADGCFTHDQIDWNGKAWSADDVHAMSLSNLDGEYCTVTTVDEVLAVIPRTE